MQVLLTPEANEKAQADKQTKRRDGKGRERKERKRKRRERI